jgi:hypothetical protein
MAELAHAKPLQAALAQDGRPFQGVAQLADVPEDEQCHLVDHRLVRWVRRSALRVHAT